MITIIKTKNAYFPLKKKYSCFRYIPNSMMQTLCDVLRDLVPFVQFRKREKRPWKSVTFSKVAG